MKIILFIAIFIIFYTYIGYGLIIYLIVLFKRFFFEKSTKQYSYDQLPSCTLIVAAYNEADFMEEKIKDTLNLRYPPGRLKIIFVTDGSTDDTPSIVNKYSEILLLHSTDRRGKIAAVHRAMEYVNTDVVVFTDANTFLNADALFHLCKHYADESVGGIAGEKKIFSEQTSDATAGEGIYWKYESKLKMWDSELYSVVGAAGELFSIRKSLYLPVPKESILDDFMISMGIASRGFKIKYEPKAYAQETSSVNIEEELKRKIRIAAGGFQSINWLKHLLIPISNPILTFQYVSHRVLRWAVTPFALLLAFLVNLYLVIINAEILYVVLLGLQIFFYLFAFLGLCVEKMKLRLKVLFIPYYFSLMNYAILAGWIRYLRGKQSVKWEKSLRK